MTQAELIYSVLQAVVYIVPVVTVVITLSERGRKKDKAHDQELNLLRKEYTDKLREQCEKFDRTLTETNKNLDKNTLMLGVLSEKIDEDRQEVRARLDSHDKQLAKHNEAIIKLQGTITTGGGR